MIWRIFLNGGRHLDHLYEVAIADCIGASCWWIYEPTHVVNMLGICSKTLFTFRLVKVSKQAHTKQQLPGRQCHAQYSNTVAVD